jgi:uncharacterized repeat protein (TIGR01451 family)
MKILLATIGLAVLLLCMVSPAMGQNLVVNGSFEADPCTGSGLGYKLGLVGTAVTGWNIPATDGIYPWCLQNVNAFGAGPAASGNQWLVLGEVSANVSRTIQQTLTGLNPGSTYMLSFAIASEAGCCSVAEVSFPSGSSTATQTFTAPAASNFWTAWATQTMNFIATSSSVTLQFKNLVSAQTGGIDLGLDNVSVTSTAQNQATSGALLTINGTVNSGNFSMPVNLTISDKDIHSGNPQTVPTGGASTCTVADQISTDSYVVQSGAPTGCDPGDLFEGTLTDGHTSLTAPEGSLVSYNFGITTHYQCVLIGGACSTLPADAKTNTKGTITSGDTGFMTVFGSSLSSFTGTITLAATSPVCGSVSDSFTGTLAADPAANVVLALAQDSSGCGGFTAAQVAPPQSTSPGTTNTLTFNQTTNNLVQHVLAFPSDAVIPTGIDPNTLQLRSANNLISNSGLYPEYVVGTPFGPSHCFDRPGNSQGGGGTDICSLYEDQCFDATHSPTEFNCPTTTTDFITIKDTFDPQTAKPPIAPNTTAVMIHFHPPDSNQSETWSPTGTIPPVPGTVNPVCTTATGTTGSAPMPPTQCDIMNLHAFALAGDQTTISGGTRRNSMFISAYNVPMLESLVTACPQPGPCTPLNGTTVNPTPGQQGTGITWFKTGSLNLDFKVNPGGCLFNPTLSPCPPAPTPANNNFVPAPVAGETYGVTGATTVPDAAAGPAPATSTVHQADFNNNPVSLSDGVNVLHWEAIDNVGILEQNIQLNSVPIGSQCPDGSTALSGACYTTNLFTAQIGVDTVAPNITISSPTNTTYALNQPVAAAYTCNDAAPSSGIALFYSVPPVGIGSNIDTSSVGSKTFTVTCTDVAGNTTTKSVTYQVAYPNAFHLLFKVGSGKVGHGQNLTYGIFLLNFGPGTAYSVALQDALPAGTSFVSAVFSEVTCTWSGCIMPTQGTSCSSSVTCHIGTLAPFTAVGVKLVVKVTALAGSTIRNTATITGFNPDPHTGNTTSNTVYTKVTP